MPPPPPALSFFSSANSVFCCLIKKEQSGSVLLGSVSLVRLLSWLMWLQSVCMNGNRQVWLFLNGRKCCSKKMSALLTKIFQRKEPENVNLWCYSFCIYLREDSQESTGGIVSPSWRSQAWYQRTRNAGVRTLGFLLEVLTFNKCPHLYFLVYTMAIITSSVKKLYGGVSTAVAVSTINS